MQVTTVQKVLSIWEEKKSSEGETQSLITRTCRITMPNDFFKKMPLSSESRLYWSPDKFLDIWVTKELTLLSI